MEIDGHPWAPDIPQVRTVDEEGDQHAVVDSSVAVDDLLSLAREAGNITRFSYEAPGLKDLFRDAVQE